MSSAESPRVGSRLEERYEILGELGAGSFGQVYRARQLSTGRDVAVKMIRVREYDTHADIEHLTARFRRETSLCAALSHPNIVRLIDSGESGDGRLYAVFEFVPGRTLREVLAAEGMLGTGEAIQLMTQVLDALSCAHAQGVVHRDLKPENIILTRTGVRRNALILDFGLGVLTSTEQAGDRSRLTASREMMGTPCYAAPEQLRGEPPSPLSDLYSWGLVLLECLTGEVAVNGSTAHEVLMKQLGPEPIPVPAWLRDRRLRRLLEAVTEKDITRRDVSVAGLLESLALLERSLAPVASPGGSKAPLLEGERRQVTILSCRPAVTRADGLAVDLEDIDTVLRTQQRNCEAIAGQQEGIVVSASGDRVLLVFGYPRAHEDDARRAVRTALRLVSESRAAGLRLDGGHSLRVALHVGVHSGVVFTREELGASGAGSITIVGDAARVAARLDEHVAADEVLVSTDTWRLLRGELGGEPLEIDQPGGGARLRAHRIVERRGAAGAGMLTNRSDTPIVGREREVQQLQAFWQRVASGGTEAMLVSGEPGIGKSRLIRELRQNLSGGRWLECRCVAENQNSPLRPIVDLLTSLPESLEELFDRHAFDLPRTMPLFASLLSLPSGAPFEPLRLSPERRKELTLTAVASLLLRMAGTQPLVLVVEDVHWADPTTLELLTLLVEEMRAARVADPAERPRLGLLMTARPEFSPPWTLGDAAALVLDRLDRGAVETLIGNELGREVAVPPALIDHIVTRTDGVPLFVEEVSRVLADASAAKADALQSARWQLEIPGTLRQLLAARLDQLSARARETIELAAALGREFRYGLLRAVAGKQEWTLREDLQELVDARLLHVRRTMSDTYVFKHALVRDAAYESMVRAARRGVHVRIADALRTQFPDLAEQQPELLAQHLEIGGEIETAVGYWQKAGDRALRRAAYTEATEHLQRGLATLERLGASAVRERLEVELLTSLGTVFFTTKGYAAPEVETTFARAHALCERLGLEVHPKILSGIIGVHINRGDREATDRLLPQFERLAEHPHDTVAAVTGLAALGLDAFWRGEHARARDFLDRARRAYLTTDFQEYVREYGYDGGIYSCAYIPWNLWVLGYPVQAEASYRELITLAEHSSDPFSLPLGRAFGVVLAYLERDAEETLARAERLVEISTEQKLYFWQTIGLFGRGGALTLRGQPEEGIPHIRQGLDVAQMIGCTTVYGHYLTFLAAAQCAAGQCEEGLATVSEALELCGRALARYHEPELHRLKGELLLQRGDVDAAEASLWDAVGLAGNRGARAWELRSATSLAFLLDKRGRRAAARETLDGIYRAFTEGLELPDARDARALLDRLR